MKKILILALAGLLSTGLAFAVPRSRTQAEQAARQFLAGQFPTAAAAAATAGQEPASLTLVPGNLLELELGLRRGSSAATAANPDAWPFYLFTTAGGGFVIISGDDRMAPVLGYSTAAGLPAVSDPTATAGLIATLPDALCGLLDEYATLYRSLGATTKHYAPSTGDTPEVAPFLTTQWAQYAPFYNQCPTSGGSRTLAGCGAIAMAQALKRYDHPQRGTGSFAYTTSTLGQQLSTNFAQHTYDWANMRDTYSSGSYTTRQGSAVAQLVYDCGVSLGMDYGVSWSNSYISAFPYAFIHYFGYNPNVVAYTADYHTPEDWTAILHTELQAQRPVIYRGANIKDEQGHIFLLDGCRDDYYHVNWGWSGSWDGWFQLDGLYTGTSNDYRYGHWMVAHISPETVGTHEDIFYGDRFYPEEDEYPLTATAKFFLDNVYNYASSTTPTDAGTSLAGQLGVALFDIDGSYVGTPSAFNFEGLKCNWGWSSTWFYINFAQLGFRDGDAAILRPVFVSSSGDVTPIRTYGAETDRLYLTVTGQQVRFSTSVPTAVRTPRADTAATPAAVGTFTLDGRRVAGQMAGARPGLYIHGGRKVLKH